MENRVVTKLVERINNKCNKVKVEVKGQKGPACNVETKPNKAKTISL